MPKLRPILIAAVLDLVSLAVMPTAPAAAPEVVRVGAGSYAMSRPAGASGPQAEVYRTEAVRGPMPTNRWWSSLAWMRYSERQYPHPLAVQAAPSGLRVAYPGPTITTNAAGVFGSMPSDGGEDLLLAHSECVAFPDARVNGHSDWFVSARFATAAHRMTVNYGHGSPFVYATYEGGSARVRFGRAPRVWAGNEKNPVLGLTVNGRHYGVFGPSGSRWAGWGTAELTCHAPGKQYFSLAVLPDDTPTTLAFFAKFAYSHVRDTRVSWRYDERSATVTTTYAFTT
ncbi:MAG TPA: glycoside hydrolase family 81, partial [Armatimonadota bacterium]|nr:glycoside hydrolase family 81 [Armatimonadota bacterium]